jgi:hypothetical protein
VKAAPPRWCHLAMCRLLILFVSLEKEFGDLILILPLNLLPAGKSDSIKLHSAYNAMPAVFNSFQAITKYFPHGLHFAPLLAGVRFPTAVK